MARISKLSDFGRALAFTALISLPAAAIAEERQAEHPMEGEVVAIDHDTGVVLLTTDSVPLTVHFPVEHVQDLSMGDRITVHLSFEKQEQQ